MTPSTAWAHLPNAPHIDRILAHLKAHPKRWNAAWDAARAAARDAAWDAARAAARDAARDAAWDAARAAAQDAAWVASRDAAQVATWSAARGAILALTAYDDCVYILNLTPGAVRVMVSVGNEKAILLYPAVIAMDPTKINLGNHQFLI